MWTCWSCFFYWEHWTRGFVILELLTAQRSGACDWWSIYVVSQQHYFFSIILEKENKSQKAGYVSLCCLSSVLPYIVEEHWWPTVFIRLKTKTKRLQEWGTGSSFLRAIIKQSISSSCQTWKQWVAERGVYKATLSTEYSSIPEALLSKTCKWEGTVLEKRFWTPHAFVKFCIKNHS